MNHKERIFFKTVSQYYKEHGRHTLPWRKTKNPYRILVSEIMLQQTQVDRVVPKYKSFLKQFPAIKDFASAPLSDVLGAWQGLGYNRRAKMLHMASQAILNKHKGVFPRTYEELLLLPGVGKYTAGAIMAFAYNSPVPIIETNIRTVYIHHFLKNKQDVADTDILKVIERTLPNENVREWYAALMDYGSFLKKQIGNQNSKSLHYKKQSVFKGSDRQLRGLIIKHFVEKSEGLTEKSLFVRIHSASQCTKERFDIQLAKLVREQLVQEKSGRVQLPTSYLPE